MSFYITCGDMGFGSNYLVYNIYISFVKNMGRD